MLYGVADWPGTRSKAQDQQRDSKAKADHGQHDNHVSLPLPCPTAARKPTLGHRAGLRPQAERMGYRDQALNAGSPQGLENRFQRRVIGAEFMAPYQPDNVPDFAHARPACARTLCKRLVYLIPRTEL